MATAVTNGSIVSRYSPDPQAANPVFDHNFDQYFEPQTVHLLLDPPTAVLIAYAWDEKRTPHREVLPVDGVVYPINSHCPLRLRERCRAGLRQTPVPRLAAH